MSIEELFYDILRELDRITAEMQDASSIVKDASIMVGDREVEENDPWED